MTLATRQGAVRCVGLTVKTHMGQGPSHSYHVPAACIWPIASLAAAVHATREHIRPIPVARIVPLTVRLVPGQVTGA